MLVDLFYTAESKQFRDLVARKISRTFGIEVKDRGILPMFERAYNSSRRQFNSYELLDYEVRCIMSDTALWIVDMDMYCENLNFVFGLAMFHVAAVVSTFRLSSPEMVSKEAIHEMGHVMGLQHCMNTCVMRFSKSIEDALQKPELLCERCKKALEHKVIEPELPI